MCHRHSATVERTDTYALYLIPLTVERAVIQLCMCGGLVVGNYELSHRNSHIKSQRRCWPAFTAYSVGYHAQSRPCLSPLCDALSPNYTTSICCGLAGQLVVQQAARQFVNLLYSLREFTVALRFVVSGFVVELLVPHIVH